MVTAPGCAARAWQTLGCSATVPTRVLSSLQHSDGTFCVKPLKQKQVVSIWVPPRQWQLLPCTCQGEGGGRL